MVDFARLNSAVVHEDAEVEQELEEFLLLEEYDEMYNVDE